LKIDWGRLTKQTTLGIIYFVVGLVDMPLIKGATENCQSRKAKADESEKGGMFGWPSNVRSHAPTIDKWKGIGVNQESVGLLKWLLFSIFTKFFRLVLHLVLVSC
jgi:hypothetical protein